MNHHETVRAAIGQLLSNPEFLQLCCDVKEVRYAGQLPYLGFAH
jgi:hypothetical protein